MPTLNGQLKQITMSKNKITKEQLYAIKTYYKSLFETEANPMNGVRIDELNLFTHPYDKDNVYIRYKAFEMSGGMSCPRIISVCVDKKGVIGDCFSKGSTMKEKIMFEQDLHLLDLSDENTKLV